MKVRRTVSKQFVLDSRTVILLAEGEDAPTRRAVEILANDLAAILGVRPEVRTGLPAVGQACLFIASASNRKAGPALRRLGVRTAAVAGKWESYLFHARAGCLVICGSDPQATLRGVYGFGRDRLGVDPFCRWHGLRPACRSRIVLENADRVTPSPAFRFRGWFLNHDLLAQWNLGQKRVSDFKARYGNRQGQSGLYGTFGPELAAMIYETCLRSDMNVIIPLNYLNIFDPEERATAELASEFGVYISFHHQEPLGANLALWKEFWKQRGHKAPEMSYYAEPAAFRTWWQAHAEAWARYERVLWVIGHRGPGDRPFWLADRKCPDDPAVRGRLISRAMESQLRCIRKACGRRPIHWCATLWQEGSPLHNAGYLRFPEGTMVVMADHGAKQLMREDFYNVHRQKTLRYGAYYHVCYGPGGPISAQGNSPDRMWHAMGEVFRKGDTAYALLNVGAIRPYYPGLACWARITTEPQDFDPERFLHDWCLERFGKEKAPAMAECYNTYFHECISPWYKGYDGARGFWDGVLSSEIRNICRMIHQGDVDAAYPRVVNSTFPDGWTYLQFQRNKSAAALGGWQILCRRLRREAAGLRGIPRRLLEDNLVVQSELMLGLFTGLHECACGALEFRDGNPRKAAGHLTVAGRAIREAMKTACRLGNTGIFRKWFTMEKLTYIDPEIARVLAHKLSRRISRKEKSWLDQKLALPRRDE